MRSRLPGAAFLRRCLGRRGLVRDGASSKTASRSELSRTVILRLPSLCGQQLGAVLALARPAAVFAPDFIRPVGTMATVGVVLSSGHFAGAAAVAAGLKYTPRW